ncbi:MAG: response regulator transcription factor [Chloroflexi bacterium]|nr:response regulator transcription factor [Chloroflexota bacterium]
MSKNGTGRKLKLLVADDNLDTIRLMTMLLQSAGHTVVTANSGEEALARLQRETVDMVLLDVMMPGMDGFTALKTLRQTSDAPILMLTALSERSDVQRGFELGADDYIVKPFSSKQLFARLNRLTALLPPQENSSHVNAGRFSFDLATSLLEKDGESIEVTVIEARILERLFKTPARAVLVDELFRAGWDRVPEEVDQSLDLVNIAIGRLRAKIEDDPDHPRYITSVSGVGYRFDPD